MGCDVTLTTVIYKLEGHEGNIASVTSIDDKYLATGGEDGTIRIWNGATRACQKTLAQHIDDVKALVRLGSDCLVSGSADGTIKVMGRNRCKLVDIMNSICLP